MSDPPATPNPYATPVFEAQLKPSLHELLSLPEKKKIETIIKDASYFWIAILICIGCGIAGSGLIALWYCVRLVQWKRMADRHPVLLDNGMKTTSLSSRFQAARLQLIIGIIVAVVFTWVIIGGIIASMIATS